MPTRWGEGVSESILLRGEGRVITGGGGGCSEEKSPDFRSLEVGVSASLVVSEYKKKYALIKTLSLLALVSFKTESTVFVWSQLADVSSINHFFACTLLSPHDRRSCNLNFILVVMIQGITAK